MPSIQSLTMTYDALNEDGTFSEGDTLRGNVTLALLKETAVESLFVKVKGDANVRWTKMVGDRTHTYSAHKRYFKLKQFLIPEDSKDTIVPQGTHVYEFSFNFPPGSMPSSFRGSHGKIVYQLEAKLSRSWKVDRTVDKEITFASKSFLNFQSFMSRQTGSTNKEMGFFSKGNVHMDAIVDRRAFAPGQTIAILAKINNSSSSEMTPKFSLIRDVVYRAQSHVNCENSVIHKVVDHCIKPQTQKTIRCAIKIPRDLNLSIQNCDIISVEYHLKVYLDISFASDPKVTFPLLICPPDLVCGGAVGPYPVSGLGGPSNSVYAPSAQIVGPYPAGAFGGPGNSNHSVAMGPYPYRHPAPESYSAPPPDYLAHTAYVRSSHSNPVPQQASPYGDPFSSPSSVLHPPPTSLAFHPPQSAPEIPPSNAYPPAPSYNTLPSAPLLDTDFLSQSDEPPPSYSLLFPTSAAEQPHANK